MTAIYQKMSARIIDYIIESVSYTSRDGKGTAESKKRKQLEDIVKQRILDGWQPHGGVSIAFKGASIVFAQALVAYEK